VVWVDPANIARNTLPPPVWIRSVSVDTKLYNDLETLEFPAHAQNIEINYTAPSLLIPQRVRFRYKLEGFDKDWRDAGVRRQAFYSKLPQGPTRFRVTASNNDGVWNEAGARFAFSISPSFTRASCLRLFVRSPFWGCRGFSTPYGYANSPERSERACMSGSPSAPESLCRELNRLRCGSGSQGLRAL